MYTENFAANEMTVSTTSFQSIKWTPFNYMNLDLSLNQFRDKSKGVPWKKKEQRAVIHTTIWILFRLFDRKCSKLTKYSLSVFHAPDKFPYIFAPTHCTTNVTVTRWNFEGVSFVITTLCVFDGHWTEMATKRSHGVCATEKSFIFFNFNFSKHGGFAKSDCVWLMLDEDLYLVRRGIKSHVSF